MKKEQIENRMKRLSESGWILIIKSSLNLVYSSKNMILLNIKGQEVMQKGYNLFKKLERLNNAQ